MPELDIVGIDTQLNMLCDLVVFPLLPGKEFERYKMDAPRGVLLYGRPGTGKTTAACALSSIFQSYGQKVPILRTNCSELLVGDITKTANLLKETFEEAKASRPSVLFLDDIHTLFPCRCLQNEMYKSFVSTLAALMKELGNDSGVVVIGATNHSVECFDVELLGPEAFERQIYFPLPHLESRRCILRSLCKYLDMKKADEFIDEIADWTPGYSIAELERLCCYALTLSRLKQWYPTMPGVQPNNCQVQRTDFVSAVMCLTQSSMQATRLPDFNSAMTTWPMYQVITSQTDSIEPNSQQSSFLNANINRSCQSVTSPPSLDNSVNDLDCSRPVQICNDPVPTRSPGDRMNTEPNTIPHQKPVYESTYNCPWFSDKNYQNAMHKMFINVLPPASSFHLSSDPSNNVKSHSAAGNHLQSLSPLSRSSNIISSPTRSAPLPSASPWQSSGNKVGNITDKPTLLKDKFQPNNRDSQPNANCPQTAEELPIALRDAAEDSTASSLANTPQVSSVEFARSISNSVSPCLQDLTLSLSFHNKKITMTTLPICEQSVADAIQIFSEANTAATYTTEGNSQSISSANESSPDSIRTAAMSDLAYSDVVWSGCLSDSVSTIAAVSKPCSHVGIDYSVSPHVSSRTLPSLTVSSMQSSEFSDLPITCSVTSTAPSEPVLLQSGEPSEQIISDLLKLKTESAPNEPTTECTSQVSLESEDQSLNYTLSNPNPHDAFLDFAKIALSLTESPVPAYSEFPNPMVSGFVQSAQMFPQYIRPVPNSMTSTLHPFTSYHYPTVYPVPFFNNAMPRAPLFLPTLATAANHHSVNFYNNSISGATNSFPYTPMAENTSRSNGLMSSMDETLLMGSGTPILSSSGPVQFPAIPHIYCSAGLRSWVTNEYPIGNTEDVNSTCLLDERRKSDLTLCLKLMGTFDNIGGLEKQLHVLREFAVYPFMPGKHFALFRNAGLRGILIHGPAGTGKTMAVAVLENECRRHGLNVFCLTFQVKNHLNDDAKYVARQLQDVFEMAKTRRPSILLFEDIDGLSRIRSNDDGQSVLPAFLTLADSLGKRTKVLLIGTTNRNVESLPRMLFGPGRFERKIYFPLPSFEHRKDILRNSLRSMSISQSQVGETIVSDVADWTAGFSGNDLSCLCIDAISRTRNRCPSAQDMSEIKISRSDFLTAMMEKVPSMSEPLSCPGRPLSAVASALLTTTRDRILDTIYSVFPQGMAGEKKLPENYSYDVNTDRKHVNPRILVIGHPGQGISGYVAPSVLHSLSHLPIYRLDLHPNCNEEELDRVFSKAHDTMPSVIYLPYVNRWWDFISARDRVRFQELVSKVDHTIPVLIFATTNQGLDRLPLQVTELFMKPHGHIFTVTRTPSPLERINLFKQLFLRVSAVGDQNYQKPIIKKLLDATQGAPFKTIRRLMHCLCRRIKRHNYGMTHQLFEELKEMINNFAKHKRSFVAPEELHPANSRKLQITAQV